MLISKSLQSILVFMPLFISACANNAIRMPIDTTVCLTIDTQEVLWNKSVDSQIIQAISKRVEKYIVNELNSEEIKTASREFCKNGDANLTVKLDTIETVVDTKLGFWAPVVNSNHVIKYHANFQSPNGKTLWDFNKDHEDESLDKVIDKLASKVSGKVEKHFQPIKQ